MWLMGADNCTTSTQWAVVLAGVSDFFRPAEKLSLTQNAALTATGFIWTRWCLIIKPKNYLYVSSAVSQNLSLRVSTQPGIIPAFRMFYYYK